MKQRINRRNYINNFVNIPKNAGKEFWIKEMVLFKRLEATYGIEFLSQFVPPEKIASLAMFFSDYGKKKLESYKNQFYYRPQIIERPVISEKVGDDAQIKTKKTIRDFLS
jgi:hypothetical protein